MRALHHHIGPVVRAATGRDCRLLVAVRFRLHNLGSQALDVFAEAVFSSSIGIPTNESHSFDICLSDGRSTRSSNDAVLENG
jgi:hypothetical protein